MDCQIRPQEQPQVRVPETDGLGMPQMPRPSDNSPGFFMAPWLCFRLIYSFQTNRPTATSRHPSTPDYPLGGKIDVPGAARATGRDGVLSGVRDMPRMKAVRLALVAAGAGILAAFILVLVLHAMTHKVVQPPHTKHPQAPGISIAKENFDLPDPFLFNDGTKYYLYLSSAFADITSRASGDLPQNTPTLTGEPGHWSKKPFDAVPKLPDWAQPGAARPVPSVPVGRPSSARKNWEVTSTRSCSWTPMAPEARASPTISYGSPTTIRRPEMARRRFGPSR
jgi:hypothetical protein